MKKFFIFVMSLLIASAAFAQESNRDANGNFQYGPYETNSFWSNWFVEAGAGVNAVFDNASQIFKGGLSHDFGGLAVNANVGKWIDPSFGFRLGWQGLTTGNLDNHITFKDSFNGDHAFNYVHGDFLLNVSNLFAGYKETRAVNVVPYLTAGAAFAQWSTRRSLAVGGGVQVPIRVSNRVSIVPEVQVLALNNHVYGGDAVTGNASVSVSARVNLGKTNWTRKATTVSYYERLNSNYATRLDNAEANARALDAKNRTLVAHNAALQNEVGRLVGENRRLASQIHNGVDTIANNFVVYFEIGKSALSAQEEAHLAAFLNDNLKADKVKVSVVGSTDTSTGSKARNTVLRKERAEYVANFIRKTYNVEVEVDTNGTEDLIKETPALSRAAVISW